VTIKPGGPDIAPPQVIAGGGADVIVDWMPGRSPPASGRAAGQHRPALQASGLMLTCRAGDGIRHAAGPPRAHARRLVLRQRVSVPEPGWRKLGSDRRRADGVRVLKQGFNVDPLLQKQADCISTMTYNEYWQVIDAGFRPDELVVFKYEDQGVSTLEDGLPKAHGPTLSPTA
jgi:NitT/TauT family transport system substrate-binding protein